MSEVGTFDEHAAEPTLLDARGLLCPLPVIRTQDRVRTLPPGALLDVLATDPGVLYDIPAWCRVHGHEVLETREAGREIRVRLRVSSKPSVTRQRPPALPPRS